MEGATAQPNCYLLTARSRPRLKLTLPPRWCCFVNFRRRFAAGGDTEDARGSSSVRIANRWRASWTITAVWLHQKFVTGERTMKLRAHHGINHQPESFCTESLCATCAYVPWSARRYQVHRGTAGRCNNNINDDTVRAVSLKHAMATANGRTSTETRRSSDPLCFSMVLCGTTKS